jgi:hypothetical protein
MLRFEREVVTALGSAPDQSTRGAVEAFVDGSLRALPEFVRLGVLGETILLGGYVQLLRAAGRLEDELDLRRRLDTWETSRISYLRQYVHLFRSMVLFAEHELGPDADTLDVTGTDGDADPANPAAAPDATPEAVA